MDTKSIGNSPTVGGVPTPKAEKQDAVAKARQRRADRANAGAAVGKGDYGVDVWGKGRDIAQARAKATEIARSTPDVREDRVAELKKKINDGTYEVEPEKIADGILREAIRDHVASDLHNEAKDRQ